MSKLLASTFLFLDNSSVNNSSAVSISSPMKPKNILSSLILFGKNAFTSWLYLSFQTLKPFSFQDQPPNMNSKSPKASSNVCGSKPLIELHKPVNKLVKYSNTSTRSVCGLDKSSSNLMEDIKFRING